MAIVANRDECQRLEETRAMTNGNELKAWQYVTNVGKRKQAIAVALSFPEGSEVRSKIFEEVNIDKLTNDDGMNVLLRHLVKWSKKDEMSAGYEVWIRFDIYTKEKEDAMEK